MSANALIPFAYANGTDWLADTERARTRTVRNLTKTAFLQR